MEIRDLTIAIGQSLTKDENLLRILHYVPGHDGDDPLDSSKPSLLDNPDAEEKWSLIDNHIKSTPKTEDLTEVPIGRVLYFMGRRAGNQNNQLYDSQDVVFDVVMHEEFAKNYQLEMAVDYLIEKFNALQIGRFDRSSDQTVGVGRMYLDGIEPIGSIAKGYFGYRLVFVMKLKSRGKHKWDT